MLRLGTTCLLSYFCRFCYSNLDFLENNVALLTQRCLLQSHISFHSNSSFLKQTNKQKQTLNCSNNNILTNKLNKLATSLMHDASTRFTFFSTHTATRNLTSTSKPNRKSITKFLVQNHIQLQAESTPLLHLQVKSRQKSLG